jgi:hypothetical protein
MKPARVAMKKLPQLTHLIFNYFRENPEELKALQPLALCKLYRRWGTFIIDCPNLEVFTAISDVQNILREPLVQLRLAKKVRLSIDHRSKVETFPITPAKGTTWEKEFKKAKLYR